MSFLQFHRVDLLLEGSILLQKASYVLFVRLNISQVVVLWLIHEHFSLRVEPGREFDRASVDAIPGSRNGRIDLDFRLGSVGLEFLIFVFDDLDLPFRPLIIRVVIGVCVCVDLNHSVLFPLVFLEDPEELRKMVLSEPFEFIHSLTRRKSLIFDLHDVVVE